MTAPWGVIRLGQEKFFFFNPLKPAWSCSMLKPVRGRNIWWHPWGVGKLVRKSFFNPLKPAWSCSMLKPVRVRNIFCCKIVGLTGKCRDRQMSRSANVAIGKCRGRQMSDRRGVDRHLTFFFIFRNFCFNYLWQYLKTCWFSGKGYQNIFCNRW